MCSQVLANTAAREVPVLEPHDGTQVCQQARRDELTGSRATSDAATSQKSTDKGLTHLRTACRAVPAATNGFLSLAGHLAFNKRVRSEC